MDTPSPSIKKIENVHILFWLLKDIAWCLVWKPLGILMIAPTLFIAVFITYVHRNNTSDLVHNSSVVLWILANSSWMLCEFTGMEHSLFGTGIPGKAPAVMFFVLGILLLLTHYTSKFYKLCIKKQ